MADRLAVYTTVYPGVEKYLSGWYRSVLAQTDRDFDVCIGVDALEPHDVLRALGADERAVRFVSHECRASARVRQSAIEKMVTEYSMIVFTDSDDLLFPDRVASARAALASCDLAGCALRVVDDEEHDLGVAFGPAADVELGSLLVRHNVFGLSNSAYRAETLDRCLPIPDDCVCVDWLLATRAWAMGASLCFDPTPHMAYRQYGKNTARVLLPFTNDQVLIAATRVLDHYRCLLDAAWQLPPAQRTALTAARDDAAAFYETVTRSAATLDRYVVALNQLTPDYVWWWCVAHSRLEDLWRN